MLYAADFLEAGVLIHQAGGFGLVEPVAAAMAEFITKLLTEKRKAFVVIGTAHLVGKDENIIDILRRKGFTIERL